MRHWIAGSAALLLTATLAGCTAAPPAFTDADATAIRESAPQFTSAMLAKNWDAWAALLSDDVVFFQPNGTAIEGKAAVRAFGEAFPPLAEFVAQVTEVQGVGDLAFARGTYRFATAASDSVPALSDQGKYLSIHRRQADGSWVITRDIWNSDLPLPGTAAAN